MIFEDAWRVQIRLIFTKLIIKGEHGRDLKMTDKKSWLMSTLSLSLNLKKSDLGL